MQPSMGSALQRNFFVLLRIALPLLLVASAPAAALDLPALIECRQGVAEQTALAPLLADPLKAVAGACSRCRRATSS